MLFRISKIQKYQGLWNLLVCTRSDALVLCACPQKLQVYTTDTCLDSIWSNTFEDLLDEYSQSTHLHHPPVNRDILDLISSRASKKFDNVQYIRLLKTLKSYFHRMISCHMTPQCISSFAEFCANPTGVACAMYMFRLYVFKHSSSTTGFVATG